MKHIRVYWMTCVLMIVAAVTASATTIVLPTDEQLIAKAPVIVEGTVVSTTPVDRNGVIWTETLVSVTRNIKGETDAQITVSEPGGVLDDRITKIFGTAEFAAGEAVLLFLDPAKSGSYRTVDLFVGKFTRDETLEGQQLWTRNDEGSEARLLNADLQEVEGVNVQRDAARFGSFVKERVSGRKGVANYGVENPVLRSRINDQGNDRDRAKLNFTLISEPAIYRWGTFDNGGSANWYYKGTQSGYTGGGVNELNTAIGAWNGYSSAKIAYRNQGVMSAAAAGMNSRNNINEVLFSDPLNEISGTWNGSGGVVGIGGYNGVSNGGTWNAPFTADATHTQRAYQAWNITEGNLVIQDGVSPSTGISSNRLAEIISHEIGHTLGFGHSADSGALMYNTVSGIGPQLRSDDQLAARWLYPNGTQSGPTPTPTVPNAPSNLSVSVSGTSATLQWSDNASDETAQQIWIAIGTGSFAQNGTVGANVTSATLNGFAAGSYRAYITASNATGPSAQSNTVNFTIAAPAPTQPALSASFSFSPGSPTTSTDVTFFDQSSGSPTSRAWSFGDGSTSNQTSPVKRYNVAGVYTVTLTIYRGSEQASTTRTISVANVAPSTPAPSANFTYSPSSPLTGAAVSFYDQSSGSPTSRYWTFGDGSASSEANPSHVYGVAGTYTVSLSVSNSAGSSSTSRTITIQNPAAPTPTTSTWRSLVSAAAQTNGLGGSVWRTELTLFNPGVSATVNVLYVPTSGGAPQQRTIFLGSLQSVTWGNALLEIFGIPNGTGALAIEATATGAQPELRVTSRTFTTGSTGTYGQSVPDVTASDLDPTLYLTGMILNASYRTNLGLVNRSSSDAGASLQLFDAFGSVVATANVTVPANSFQQAGLATYFPAIAGREFNALSMRVSASASNAVSVYASVVDNRSQDPVFIQGSRAASGSSLMLAAVGRVPGVGGTYWRSDVSIYNPSSSPTVVYLKYLAANQDNRFASSTSLSISGNRTVMLDDIASRLGVSSGTGALEISWSGPAPVVTSRTYTTVDSGGTYGQSIDPVTTWASDVFVPGVRSDNNYRSNIGFVNRSEQAIGITVSLISSNGFTLATGFVTLQPKSQTQMGVSALFPNVDASTLGMFTIKAHTDTAGVMSAYASIVDNSSGDPVFFAGK